MSRFQTSKEQKKVLEHLEEGKVDIIIGTHKLLQADIKFKELGLVVIDEQQIIKQYISTYEQNRTNCVAPDNPRDSGVPCRFAPNANSRHSVALRPRYQSICLNE